MSELIFTKPGINILSGNSIDFEVAVTPYNYNRDQSNTYLVISIAAEVAEGVFDEVKSQKVYPDQDGLVSYDISSIVDAYLGYFVPPVNLNTLVRVPEQAKRFSIKCSLFSGLDLLVEQTRFVNCIKAGAAFEYFNTDLTYSWQGDNTPPLLLYITDGKDVVSVDDIFFLHFASTDQVSATLFLRYNINYMLPDETYSSVTGLLYEDFETPLGLGVFCVPAGYNQLNLQQYLPDGAVPVSYRLTIMGNAGSLGDIELFPAVWLTIDQRKFYDSVQLVYRNSLGGLQPLRLLGQIDTEGEYKYQQVNRMLPPSYLVDGNLMAETEQPFSEENMKFSGQTGFITKYQADRLRDFFLSKQRFQLKDGRLVPIILNTKTVKFFTNKDNLISVQVDWQHAFTNHFYSNTSLPPDVCPAMTFLLWRQTNNEEITVFWSFPFGHNYGRISLEFPGEDPQLFYLNGNSGVYKFTFERPDSAVGVDVDVVMRGVVICNRYNAEISLGPELVLPEQTITAKKLPVAVDDSYDIAVGFITPVPLTPSALANDYDPGGLPIEVIADSGSTADGGSFTIDAAGNITYTPPSSTYNGSDTFTYEIRETPAGTPVSATVTINVGTVSQKIYAKIILRNYNPAHTNNGEVWIDFFSNPAGTIPLDVSAFPFTVNYNKRIVVNGRGSSTETNTPLTAAATGFRVLIFTGALYQVTSPDRSVSRSFGLLAGTGYTPI